MKQPVIQRCDSILQVLRMVSLFTAFLYITFGFSMKHVLGVDDPIPLTHRAVFAACFGGLAGLSYTSLLVRKHMALLSYALGCAAVLNVLLMGTQGEFDAGSIVALLLVVPIMNFLFYRWTLLLYANALLLLVIVGVFTASIPSFAAVLLFLTSSAAISGVSFWFTRRLLTTEIMSATNEQMFRDLFRHSMDGIAIHELIVDDNGEPVDYIFLEVNPIFEEYTGLKGAEILGKRVTEVLPGIEDSGFVEKYGAVVRTGESIHFEQFSEPLQRHFKVAAYSMDGHRFATVFEDITERKKSEQHRYESEEKFRTLFEHCPDGVFIVSTSGIIMDCNERAASMNGYTKAELVGCPIGRLNPEETTDVVQYALRDRTIEDTTYLKALREQDSLLLQTSHRTKDHSILPIETSVSLVTIAGQEYTIGFDRDVSQRQSAEEEVRRQHGLIQSLLDSIPDIIFYKDVEGVYLGCNPSFAEFVGVSTHQIVGKTDYDLFGRETADFFRQHDRRVLELGQPRQNEEWITYPDSRSILIDTLKTPYVGADGQLIGILGISRDITERKEAEEQLAKRDELLTKLSQQVPGAIYQFRYHPDGRSCFPFASDGIWNIYEVKPDDVKHDADVVFSRIYAEDYHRVVASVRHSYKTLTIWEDEYRVVLPEQGLRWIRGIARPEKLPDDSVLWHGYLDDITEMKSILEDLRSKTEELDRYFTSSLDLLCIANTEGKFIRLNPQWESILGYAVSELEGTSFLDFVHPEDMPATLEAIRQLDANEEVINFENRYLGKDGTYRWIEWRSKPIGSTIYAVARDVTSRRLLEDELRESEALNRSIVTALPDIIFKLNRSGEFLDVITPNDDMLFVPKEEMLGKTAREVLPEESAKIIIDAVEQSFLTNVLKTCVYVLSVPTATMHFEARIVPVDGKTAYALVRDVTDREEAEEKLVQYTAELEMRGLEMNRLYNALDTEMQNARQAHQRLVQKRLPEPNGISLAVSHNPATFVGGDFAYVIQKNDLLILYITDITGHGLEGTIFGLFVKGCIESYLELAPESDIVPDKILTHLDQQVHKGRYPSEYAVSIFLMIVNVESREATFSSAGFQNPPVLVHSDGVIEMLVSQGLPISPDIAFEVMEFDLQKASIPDDTFLFLATDGIHEQRSGDEMYEQRLLRLLKQCAGLPHSTIKDVVDTDFRDFLNHAIQDDDVTFVVLSTQNRKEHILPSSWGSLDTLREHVRDYYGSHPDCDVIAMAAHELVANGIEHGNKFHTDKHVKILLTDKAVVVEDEGDGFDWRSKSSSELRLDLDSDRGRGIAMVRMLAGKLVYNAKGNRVSLLI